MNEDISNFEFKNISENNYDIDSIPWQIECNKLLDELGLNDSGYVIQMPAVSILKELKRKYQMQSVVLDDYGHFVNRNPVFNYIIKSSDAEKELYSLGRTLGLINDLGKYYYFIPDINFSRGFWLGRVEKAIIDDDYEALQLVKDDMEFVRPGSSENEFDLIRKNMFDDKDSILIK